MTRFHRGNFTRVLLGLVLLGAVRIGAQEQHPLAPIRYLISLADPATHTLRITIQLPAGANERDLQLPVWNGLYQIRDFSQYVNSVHATNEARQAPKVQLLNKSRWRVSGALGGAEIEYEVFADVAGPFGAQLNTQHAFLNLAEVLMYPLDARSSPMHVRFTGVPSSWRIATALADSSGDYSAENYDRLVDSPVEIGVFQESDFDQDGAHYRVVVDADSPDYDISKLVSTLQKITAAATGWMNDRPFQTYLFLYHFPRGPAGGGMEHAYCTAIDINAQVLNDNPAAFEGVTAHEFFHLWNVKRIRPQSLEPIDYTQENYTTALWFSEGVTTTAGNIIRFRAGLLDEPRTLKELANQIAELQRRPAHLTQSVEEASLDAWLEKYDYYRLPVRSISYYNKGNLLGVLLDLKLRQASNGAASLRDLFQWMNRNYPQQGRFFADSPGVQKAAETIGHTDLSSFVQKYVTGTDEIPWDDFFQTVGLHLQRRPSQVADLGFVPTQNFHMAPTVGAVTLNGEAERAGLRVGDTILEINGHAAGSDLDRRLAELRPGDRLRLRIRSGRGERELHWKLGSREEVDLVLQDVDNVTPVQKARRTAWLRGESQTPGEPHP